MNTFDLENRLKKLVSKFPDLDILPNTFLQLVKPTEELLGPYRDYFDEKGPKILYSRLLFFPRIISSILKSLLISMSRIDEINSWNMQHPSNNPSLFITHFTNAQLSDGHDAFFGELLDRTSNSVLFLNSTRLRHKNLRTFYGVESRRNLNFMTKSLNPGAVLLIHLRYLVISLEFLAHSFESSLDAQDKWLLIEAGVKQHSRATMANKFFESRVSDLIEQVQPKVIHFTFEGHSHEVVLINLIHKKFERVVLAPYQHAPIVPEQFGLMRNINRLRKIDRLYTSGRITQDYFKSFRSDIPIIVIGSSKFKEMSLAPQRRDRVKVIGASEGTIQSLQDFIKLFASLATHQSNFDFYLRVHPAISERELRIALQNAGNVKVLISRNSLHEDLSTSTYCIFRSSAVAIEGLAYGVTPIYFDQSRSQGLNPLYLAGLHLPAFGSAEELASFFEDVSTLDASNQGINPEQLYRISEGYFSKIEAKFPKDF